MTWKRDAIEFFQSSLISKKDRGGKGFKVSFLVRLLIRFSESVSFDLKRN